ncbi:hypothetical protein [Alkalihalobacillus trypoxylicola]|uniref:Uncharacterized protein n=1 Tax=Alkalihalobacillus trypoxylicola TaxID=519424 RepID=A0A162DN15_9BACI|nr:hypothetical protein [Alkalihalobacillus trypoxylicola]KYG30365.1 hypothetical protein AZF04_19970 [Alkalihalobacillus trypoxylicola]
MEKFKDYQWRVTKYNPDFRDENGYYTLDEEWTCPSEIGKNINGKEFTLEQYLHVEASYIHSVIQFMEESRLDSLRILQLECDFTEEARTSPLYEKEFEQLNLREDVMLNKHEIRLVCKMVLRNFIWCKLYGKKHFFIHFGYDYYMYIGSHTNCLSAIESATNSGLFVETFMSPYFITEAEIIRETNWNEKDV